MADKAKVITKYIAHHNKLIAYCENEFRSNIARNPQASCHAVALQGAESYGCYAVVYSGDQERAPGVKVLADANMARVMAICAAHLALSYLGMRES